MEKKSRKHLITDKAPVPVSLVLMIIGIILPSAIANPVAGIFGGQETQTGVLCTGIVAMLVSFLLMWLYTQWFKPEFEGNLGKNGITKGLKLLIPYFALWTVYYIVEGLAGEAVFDFGRLPCWTAGFAAGITEEVAFRGLAVTTLHRKFRSEKNIWIPGFLIGILFGLVHLLNITAGEDPVIVLLTSLFAAGAGILFGSVYTSCGNLWPVIIAHGLYDSVSFSIIEDAAPTATDLGPFTYAQIIIMFALGIFLFVQLMKKRKEASDLWDRKWKISA